MATNSFRKSQLIAFDNVAAGQYVAPCVMSPFKLIYTNSDGVLSDPSGALVVKPCKQSEIDFYESTSSHPDFVPYIPTYMGKLSLGSDTHTAQVAGSLILSGDLTPEVPAQASPTNLTVEKAWAPSNGGKIQTDLAVILENIAAGYRKPNILDVKLGKRLWADDAPAEKRARLDKAAEETTSQVLGFRIAGMKTFQGEDMPHKVDLTPDGYKLFDKNYGRTFNVHTIQQGFEEYFLVTQGTKPASGIRKVIKRFLEDLKGIATAIENEESRMYSASLLFVYEGDRLALDHAFSKEVEVLKTLNDNRRSTEGVRDNGATNTIGNEKGNASDDEDEAPTFPAIQSLKLIDFAHAQWTPGQGPDSNLLHGIRNVSKILADLVNRREGSTLSSEVPQNLAPS